MTDPVTVYLEDLTVGQSLERTFTATDTAIRAFAEVSEDHNPVHVDEAYAATTPFKGRIAHGALLNAWISAAIAGGLPGRGSIYVSQSLNFKRAVKIDDVVTIALTVTDIQPKTGLVTLTTVASVGGKTYAKGVAEVIAPRKPA
ncbi:MaoC family dehydratase [Asticcacaulis sp. AND118]|uniref:MaoC family dehydratase n=1 Tax=Asticcacaulis sp. AND118 TaxID=2840468 RepID=UPI001D00192C|nr:MaoC family dehydratase [Asticcacaulis sp. AND118]UDF04500.1 MaoC family dehydratase [Asticcacaulis sp. AND118]